MSMHSIFREDFPIFRHYESNGKPFIYLDTASSAQKPQQVLSIMNDYYSQQYASVGRGSYGLANQVYDSYERVRSEVQAYLNATNYKVIFTHNATDSLNLIAYGYLRHHLQPNDRIYISPYEHHANQLPFRAIAYERGATVCWLQLTESGDIDLNWLNLEYEQHGKAMRFLSLTQMSNITGFVPNYSQVLAFCQSVGIVSVLDGSQGIVHQTTHLDQLLPHFYAFSAHKVYGPLGVGVLCIHNSLWDSCQPFRWGGGMSLEVNFDDYTISEAIEKFETGTLNSVGVMGLGQALHYIQSAELRQGSAYELQLRDYTLQALMDLSTTIPLKIVNLPQLLKQPQRHGPIISFYIEGLHSLDMSDALNLKGVMMRCGKMCSHTLVKQLGDISLLRLSLGLYNNSQDIQITLDALSKGYRLLKRS